MRVSRVLGASSEGEGKRTGQDWDGGGLVAVLVIRPPEGFREKLRGPLAETAKCQEMSARASEDVSTGIGSHSRCGAEAARPYKARWARRGLAAARGRNTPGRTFACQGEKRRRVTEDKVVSRCG